MEYEIINFDKEPLVGEYYIQIDIDGFLHTGFLKKHGEIKKGDS